MSPVYRYTCPECGEQAEDIRSMDDRRDAPECECGETMELRISQTHPPRVRGGTPRFHN